MDAKSLGPYELIRLLGRGGMGEVYLARDRRLGREVALKLLSPELASREEFRSRFLQEARSVSALSHPNLTAVHEIGTAGERDYISFEYVRGKTLESLLGEGELSLERFFDISLPLAEALDYAHRHGIVHRDLKPANVMISELGIPKILDFGLAKVIPPAADSSAMSTIVKLTASGMMLGTIAFMSPEQALGKEVDRRSDIFSFGSLLYQMAGGKPAFSGPTVTQVLDNLLHREPPPLERLRPDIPVELRQVVEKCLRKDPVERYQQMWQVVTDLRHLKRQSDSGPIPARLPSAQKRERRRSAVLLAAAAVLVLGGAALLYRSVRPALPPPPPGSLAVMYFENLAQRADSDNLARMLTGLLTTELSGAEGLEVVSGQKLYDVAKKIGRDEGLVDRSVATEVARRAGVATMVLGQIARVGEKMVATSELVDVASGHSLASQKAEGRAVEDIFSMAEALAEQVRGDIRRPSPMRVARDDLTRKLTGSVEAYRAYVGGEVLLHRHDFAGAAERFREAVRLDPEFALAHYRLSIASRWLAEEEEALEAAERAVGLLERLPAGYQDIVKANSFYQQGAYSRAIPLLESALAGEPENKEALYLLSQIYVHSARDTRPDRAAELMEKLLSVDPDFRLVYDHLALAYALDGEMGKAREKLSLWEADEPRVVETMRAVLATLDGRPDEALGLSQSFSWIEGLLFRAQSAMLASRWDLAQKLVSLDPGEFGKGYLRAWALRNRGDFYAYRGEFDRALQAYRQAGEVVGFRSHEGNGGGISASALQSRAELLALKGDLRAARAEAERALTLQPESPRCLYFAGAYAAREGDLAAAEGHLERLLGLPAMSGGSSARLYRDALEAEMALVRREFSRARSLFEGVVGSRKLLSDWASTCSSAGAAFREGMVRTYLAVEENGKAARELEGLLASGSERLNHPVLYVRSLYALGSLKIKMGEPLAGREILQRFLEHWGRPDWDLPEVRDARARLRR